MTARNGAPGRGTGGARQIAADQGSTYVEDTAPGGQSPGVHAGLSRRAAAARRLPPLADGCVDPWRDHPGPPYSLRSARSAWHHLRAHRLLSDVVEAVLAAGTDDRA